MEIRSTIYSRPGFGELGEPVGEVIISEEGVMTIELLPNREVIFRASLEILAWQMCTLSPDLAKFIVKGVM